MSATHSALLNMAAAAVSALRGLHCRVFRNEVGQAIAGRAIAITKPTTMRLQLGDYVVRHGHRVTYGLVPGSGDLIGYTLLEIRQEHVGRTVPVFTSLEGKVGTDRLRPDQVRWHDTVRQLGGFSVVFRSADEAVQGILAATGAVAGQSAP